MGSPIVHFEILGSDLERLAAFYRALFDWTITPVEEGGGYAMVETGGGAPGAPTGGVAGFPGAPSHVTVYVGVDDVAATLARARDLGATIVMEPREVTPGVETALFADPEGHTIGLMRRSEPG
ncbi:MAG TPA: VOC family protein [Thermoleophilaceae bacterium]|nr:VOC family protein [Thermoleophilaceae bacterium]